MTNTASKLTAIEKVTTRRAPEISYTIVPSWGDYVTVNGEQVLRSDYKPNPNAKKIYLSWGDDD